MKRDVLFKGKRVKNNTQWVEGYYCEWKDCEGKIHPNIIYNSELFHTEVIPETVGQFTGLLDKNGVKIFEGDIIKGGIYASYEVKWDYEECGWNIKSHSQHHFEIIGNIHDNPELL